MDHRTEATHPLGRRGRQVIHALGPVRAMRRPEPTRHRRSCGRGSPGAPASWVRERDVRDQHRSRRLRVRSWGRGQDIRSGPQPPPLSVQAPRPRARGCPTAAPRGAWSTRVPPAVTMHAQRSRPRARGCSTAAPRGAWSTRVPPARHYAPAQRSRPRARECPAAAPRGAWSTRVPPARHYAPAQRSRPHARECPAAAPRGAWSTRVPPARHYAPAQRSRPHARECPESAHLDGRYCDGPAHAPGNAPVHPWIVRQG